MSILEKLKKLSSKQSKRIVALFLMLSLGASSAITVAALSKNFRIKDGDNVINIRTLHSETNDVLKQAGISIGENDKVIVTNNDSNNIDIDIKRAFNVKVFSDGTWQSFIANDGTVADLLAQHNIIVKENDTVEPNISSLLTPDMQITVSRFFTVNVTVDGESKEVNVPEGTVEGALSFLNISLSQFDIINEPLNRPIENGLNIVINRVEFKEETEKQVIPFSTTNKKTDSLNKGDSKIETNGVNGEKNVVKRIKYVDGKAVEASVVSESVLKAPVNQVKLVGTKSNGSGNATVNTANGTVTDSNGNVYHYKGTANGVCTGYCPGTRSCPGTRTASGVAARRGLVAANLKQFPIGTKLYVPDYGVCTVADTGGAMRSGRAMLDLCMDNEHQCRSWGRRTKQVYILS